MAAGNGLHHGRVSHAADHAVQEAAYAGGGRGRGHQHILGGSVRPWGARRVRRLEGAFRSYKRAACTTE